ncbi:hypothetical protein [Altericista sp. CCNU0014]|uniref:hypothetical protein n=1 Tax=Altericista sp. CCNU0014 TaxID=3082949 RepID=UPI00384BDE24
MTEKLNPTLKLSNGDNASTVAQEQQYVLPRQAWNDRVAYFRVLFKTKKALDLIDRKNDISSI